VLNSHGKPVSGGSISASGNGRSYATTTSSSGSFALSGLAPGSYTVTARTRFSSAGVTTSVAAGTNTSVTVTVSR